MQVRLPIALVSAMTCSHMVLVLHVNSLVRKNIFYSTGNTSTTPYREEFTMCTLGGGATIVMSALYEGVVTL